MDIQEGITGLKTCAGQKAGIEAAIYAMKETYNNEQCDCLLMVDAINAFNSLNRKAVRRNTKMICPNLAHFIENSNKTS